MRYLKLYEDHKTEEYLQDMVNNYLAYLLDDNYKIFASQGVYNSKHKIESYYIKMWKASSDDNVAAHFNFDDVKDDLIPFLEFLETKYTITSIDMRFISNDGDVDEGEFTANEVINEELDDINGIRWLYINITEKQ